MLYRRRALPRPASSRDLLGPGLGRALATIAVCSIGSTHAAAQEVQFAKDSDSAAVTQQKTVTGPWLNQALAPDARAKAALKAMTSAEKIAIINASPLGVPRLGIPDTKETDASLGVANLGNMRKGFVATALPASLAVGASWDQSLARKGGEMVGAEARANGFGIVLGGGANLIRDPRAGRNFEYFSEDPLLTGVLAGNAIAGIQSNHIISTLKHYALNNQETGRAVYSVEIGEQAMRQTELLGFELAHEIGKPGSVMCSYNRVNGVYACENRHLLIDVLRHDWGFKGFVMSDWGGVHSTESLVLGLDKKSGGNIDTKLFFSKELEPKLADGTIPHSAVDAAVLRILRAIFAAGLVDQPPVKASSIDYAAHAQTAQMQAEGGIVLLRNEGDILPLAPTVRSIAVIGGHADKGVLSGGGSSQVVPVGGFALEIRHKGPIKRSYGGTSPLAALRAAFPAAEITFVDGTDPAAARAAASKAELAIVFVEKWFNESDDQPDIGLGAAQDRLIDEVSKGNSRTVVVLETGNPVLMPWLSKVPAIVESWFPGQRGAEAIVNVLSGRVNPSGHLPVTWPASQAQLPLPELPGWSVPRADAATIKSFGYSADRLPFAFSYPEGVDIGYRWYQRKGTEPLFPFGYGLSYTAFHYDQLQVSGGRAIKVSFHVTNTGHRAGADVPQVYVSRPGAPKRLVGWAKPFLEPGETTAVTITADARIIGDYDTRSGRWLISPGTYVVEVASDARTTLLSHRTELRRATVKP
jgi:beta-glucosidase